MAFNTQNVTGTAKTTVTLVDRSKFESLSLASVHSGDAAVVDLYVAGVDGTNITDTGTNMNQATAPTTIRASTSETALTVDGTTATDDLFLNEKVYKSDGTLFGTCTAVASGTSLQFSGGLEQFITNNDDLYTGTRVYLIKAVTIPTGATLILEAGDINFNTNTHALWIKLSAGSIDIMARQ